MDPYEENSKAVALIEEAGIWAAEDHELHQRIYFLAEHFATEHLLSEEIETVTREMLHEVMVITAKALETGIYIGKFGFPSERVPDAFKKALEE